MARTIRKPDLETTSERHIAKCRLFRSQQDYFVTEGNGQNPSQNSDYDWLQAARNP